MKVNISPSTVRTYKTCPKKFYYSRQDIPELVSPIQKELQIGGDFHDVIRNYYKKITEKDKNPTKTQVEEMLTMDVDDYDSLRDNTTKVPKLISGFAKFEKWRQEEGWQFESGELHKSDGYVTGIPDAIFKKRGEKLVVDWKTGLGYSVSKFASTQLGIYKLLTDADRVMIVKVAYNRRHEMEPNLDEVRDTINEVRNKIKHEEFERRESDHCDICEYNVYCWAESYGLDLEDI